MDLIIGGAYQGKLDYARARFGVADAEVYRCADQSVLDRSRRCIWGFERYLRACWLEGVAPITDLRGDAVIICTDIFCGVVPVDDDDRGWREQTGRIMTALANRADTVTRIFCGLPQRLKPQDQPNP